MVVPLAGPLGPEEQFATMEMLAGPPPAQLHGKCRVIKWSIVVMFVFTLSGQLAASLIGPEIAGREFVSAGPIIYDIFMGIWLLRDDPMILEVYRFLSLTLCRCFGDHCPGGMSCLLQFTFFNLFYVIYRLVLEGNYGIVYDIFVYVKVIQEVHAPLMKFVLSTLLVCKIGVFLGQVVAAIFSFLTYKHALLLVEQGVFDGVAQNAAGRQRPADPPLMIEMTRRPVVQASQGSRPFVAFTGRAQRLSDGHDDGKGIPNSTEHTSGDVAASV